MCRQCHNVDRNFQLNSIICDFKAFGDILVILPAPNKYSLS